jgi:hypothetical protein
MNQNTPKQAFFKSPILGAFFALLIFFIYFIILLGIEGTPSQFVSMSYWLKGIYNFLIICPLVLIVFILISYGLSISIGYVLFKLKEKNFWSEGFFWFSAWLSGLAISLFINIINNYYNHISLGKMISISIALSFGALFNASLFSVLIGKIQPKYKLDYENK